MNGPTRVGAFVLALAGSVATGFAVGRVTDAETSTGAPRPTVTTAPASTGAASGERLHFDFAHAGTVRTAELTVDVPVPTAPSSPTGQHSGH